MKRRFKTFEDAFNVPYFPLARRSLDAAQASQRPVVGVCVGSTMGLARGKVGVNTSRADRVAAVMAERLTRTWPWWGAFPGADAAAFYDAWKRRLRITLFDAPGWPADWIERNALDELDEGTEMEELVRDDVYRAVVERVLNSGPPRHFTWEGEGFTWSKVNEVFVHGEKRIVVQGRLVWVDGQLFRELDFDKPAPTRAVPISWVVCWALPMSARLAHWLARLGRRPRLEGDQHGFRLAGPHIELLYGPRLGDQQSSI